MSATFRSHLLTIAPTIRGALLPHKAPPSSAWSTRVEDPEVGPVVLSGKLATVPDDGLGSVPGTRKLCVIVHGLAGGPDSHYCIKAARVAVECGYDALRLALRGADLSGEDVHHAALTDDLHAVLAAPDIVERYSEIYVLGYSLGGHMALHAAVSELPAAVKKIAAICPPLDLRPCQQHIDRMLVYRMTLVSGLRAIHRALASRGRADPKDLRRIRSIWDWDRLVICKRFGFASPLEYYDRMSIRSRYLETRRPLLIVGSRHDPLVPFDSVREHLGESEQVTVRFFGNEGHVHFSRQADTGFGSGAAMERQVFAWFEA